jgi:hypothetical protein
MKEQKLIQTDLNQDQIRLLEDLILQDSSTSNILKTLFEAALLYIRSEQIEGDPEPTRADFAFNLEVIRDTFDKIGKAASLSNVSEPESYGKECPECIKKEGVIEHLQFMLDNRVPAESSEKEWECRTLLIGS